MYSIQLAVYSEVSKPPTSLHQVRDPPQRATHRVCFAILLTAKSFTSDLHNNEATGELGTRGIPFLHSNASTKIQR